MSAPAKSDIGRMRQILCVVGTVVILAGCAPALTPLYRDYEEKPRSEGATLERIERALQASKWTVEEGVTANTLATEPRTFRSWGLYSVEVELEVVPLADDHVRVLVHPYRKFFQGTRRKVPYLRRSLARTALKELNSAMEAEGLALEGTAQSRDRNAGIR